MLQVWSRIMPYIESFAWAIIPLFDSNMNAPSRTTSPGSPLAPNTSGSLSQDPVLEPTAKITTDGKLNYSSAVGVEVSNLNKVKESYTETSLQKAYGILLKKIKENSLWHAAGKLEDQIRRLC